MAKTTVRPARRISLSEARQEWFRRQLLSSSAPGPLDSIVEKTGWVRTLGGAEVYIACWARQADFRFDGLNEAVRRRDLEVLPSVRGCIYLVPRLHAALALSIAEEQWRPRTGKELEKAGSSWKEVEEISGAVLDVLAKSGQTPDGLRKAMPPGTVRPLGEKGKKVGLSSVLPVALRHLEFAGKVRRVLPGGRLDSEKYVWEASDGARSETLPAQPAARLALLARLFLEFASPASSEHFADWAGISKKPALQAMEEAGAEPVELEGEPRPFLSLPWSSQPSDPARSVALLPFEDNLIALHGGTRLLTDPGLHSIPVPTWGSSKLSTLGEGAHMALRPIVVDGQIAGLWEFDPDSSRIVTKLLMPAVPSTALQERCASLEQLLSKDLGHGHSYSLDTDAQLRERVAYLRALS